MADIPVISLVTAKNYNIAVYKGDTTKLVLQFINTEDSTPQSQAGAAFKVQVRSGSATGSVAQEFSTSDGDIVISGADNSIVTIGGWEDLAVGEFWYDLQRTLSGEVRTYLTGKVIVSQDVTT